MTASQLLSLASIFGQPIHYPQLPGLKDSPYVTSVTKLPEERVNFGGVWHTDTSYVVNPPYATVLYAVKLGWRQVVF